MNSFQILELLLHIMVFLLGAGIGSFLNVVIYRLPLGMSVSNPKRSFCPKCKKQIAWYHNLPLLSWLFLRGKCAYCKGEIPFRYFFVELLTACFFYAVFLKFSGPLWYASQWGDVVVLYWIFTALLIAGTYIDLDHYILPHQITLGGLGVGLIGSYIAPELMGEQDRGLSIVFSFVSACFGLGLLWSVVELGKLAFGRLKHRFDQPEEWSITQTNEDEPPVLKVAGDELSWADIFTRPSDRIIIEGTEITVNESIFAQSKTEIKMETMKVKPAEGSEQSFQLEAVTTLKGKATEIVIPREAMGFGDVLLLAMIGSFLGWKAVIFTIFAASLLACLFALVPRIFGKTEWTAKIPFGPYLAGGAMIWLFYGPPILAWYLDQIGWNRMEI